ncbi:hypothetical protein F5878DRAFT_640642 [Lentinula raphanica]|uniref:Uncharacterized protein n=1 Tax=Lentinula raphanica TaxID=153919 RepID=A0AA38PC04_9AGAR|nr:hypothetical protein F5878DRAFT_640642 [Lentinula raphanica]
MCALTLQCVYQVLVVSEVGRLRSRSSQKSVVSEVGRLRSRSPARYPLAKRIKFESHSIGSPQSAHPARLPERARYRSRSLESRYRHPCAPSRDRNRGFPLKNGHATIRIRRGTKEKYGSLLLLTNVASFKMSIKIHFQQKSLLQFLHLTRYLQHPPYLRNHLPVLYHLRNILETETSLFIPPSIRRGRGRGSSGSYRGSLYRGGGPPDAQRAPRNRGSLPTPIGHEQLQELNASPSGVDSAPSPPALKMKAETPPPRPSSVEPEESIEQLLKWVNEELIVTDMIQEERRIMDRSKVL